MGGKEKYQIWYSSTTNSQKGVDTQRKEWESSVEIWDCKVIQRSYDCIQNN